MLQNIPVQIKKLLAIFMIMILFIPNVYCLENSNVDPEASLEDTQLDSTLSKERKIDLNVANGDAVDINNGQVVDQDTFSDGTTNVDTTPSSMSISSVSVSPSLVEMTTYLDSGFENHKDYFDTNLFTGSFGYTYPIEVVKGIGELAPQLSLKYNSMEAKGTYGMTGNGWHISDYYVMRDVHSTPSNTNDDRFVLNLDGSMYDLVEVDGSYYTETEMFMKISKEVSNSNTFGDYWIVTFSDGMQYRFGYTNESEQVNSVDSRNYVSKWWLDSIEDVNGNQITYHYSENPIGEEGYTYPTSINYNNNISHIDFGFTDKPHLFTLYEQGNRVQGKQVLSNITVWSNSTLLWHYDLEYQAVGTRLLLKSIGKRTLTQAFPDTVFEYDSGSSGWVSNNSWKSPVSLTGHGGEDNGIRFMDVNGDGLTDILRGVAKSQYNTNHYREAWLNNGNGWEVAISWAPPTSFVENDYDSYGNFISSSDLGVRFADVNGDGLIDILQSNRYDNVWMNTGSGWVRDRSWEIPFRFDRFGIHLVDVNGDELVDIVNHEDDEVWINSGSDWEIDNSWQPPVSLTGHAEEDNGIRFMDINGDGLIDILRGVTKYQYNTNHYREAWLNTGSGWEVSNSWAPSTSFVKNNYDYYGNLISSSDLGVRFTDVNGDGFVDILRGDNNENSWLNTGNGWVRDRSWEPPIRLDQVDVRLVDVNGDGFADIVDDDDDALINIYNTPGFLKEIKHSTGATTTVKYIPSTRFDNTGDDTISDLPGIIWVVSQVIRNNGMSGSTRIVSITNYTYKDGMQFFNPPEDIEFWGFGEVTVENNYAITKHTFHQDSILKGIEYHTEVWDENGTHYSTSEMEYRTQEIYPNVNLILLHSISRAQFDGLTQNLNDSIGWTSFTEYGEYDDYGNPLSITEYGDVNVTGDEKYLQYEYLNDEDDWILGKVIHERLEDSNRVKKSESWYYYDGSSDNSNISKGQLTKTVSWNDMGPDPSVLYNYDSYGNIIQVTDPKGSSNNIEYDDNHLYPILIENALGQKERYEYNDLGRIIKITDSSGISTEYVYDDLHRISKVIKVGDNLSSPSIEHIYYQDGVAPEWISTRLKENNNGTWEDSTFESIDYFDGFRQLIQKKYEGEDSWIIQNTTYNELGLAESIEVPHYLNQSSLSINYEYDAISRPKVITNTDGTTLTYHYNLENTTITNQNGINKTLTSDIFGNIVKVYEFNKGETYVTSYTYDAMTNLVEIKPNALDSDYNLPPINSTGPTPDGTEFNPYSIYTVSDLQSINNDLSSHYILMNDIDASETSTWNNGAGFVPIGTSTEMFTGSIDGNGYNIDGLTINREWTNAQGFVAYLDDGGEIKNLGLIDVSVTGYQYVGSLVVFNHGTISNCFSTGSVTAGHNNVGGLVAGSSSTGRISDSYSRCAVTCAGTQAGGLSGYNNGNIIRCYATGFVNCANTKGGITGSNSNTVTDCYYDSETTGCSDTDKGTPKTTVQMQTHSTFVGWDFDSVWSSSSQINGGYPFLQFINDEPQIGEEGSVSNPYKIYTVSDLQAINNNLSSHYILMNDIDASETSAWNNGAGFVPIGTSTEMFTGSIDGNGYNIDGLTINRQLINVQGFVAYLGDGGEIKNLGLTDVSVTGYQYVGSLVVFNHGTISNCFSTGSVTGGHNNVGGLVAGSSSTGRISDSYSRCAVTCAGTQAGGLSGYNNGNIIRCYATGFVNCANTKGGITGSNSNTVTDCYYDSEITGCSDIGKGTPKTTAQMQTQSTFTGWDFSGTWEMQGYPKHKFLSPTPLTLHVCFTYDSLGRKVAMSDPDMGNWVYEYDLNGNLINQTDARGVTTRLSYDSLDRVIAIDYPTDADVSFTYDLEYNGTLSQVTRGSISSNYDYDQRYRIVDETVTLDSTPYTTSYEYDSMDRVTKITYPDGAGVNLTYNAQTLLESVEGIIDNLDYNARNQIITKELSNGVVTNYTYDSQKLLLDRIYTHNLQDLNYDFDNVGNILEIEDNVLSSVKTYGYDDLDRLTSAGMSVNSVPTYQRDFTYDQYGCIRQVDENNVTISSYGYNVTPFHAPVTYNGNDLEYDPNGNLVEDEDFIYIYNDANQLREVRYSGNSSLVEKYWYDANGQRVKKQNADGEFTYYVNKFYEVDNGVATSYFFRDDERIAKQTAGDVEWYLSDHLGSTTLLVDESGLEVERTEYYPYGQVQSGGLEKYGFTGQENDADTGLMYYGARYYSPEYRVFVQPDTMLPDPYNPQALNRYSYALSNPVKYTDPSGHVPLDTIADALFLLYDGGKYLLDQSDENKRNLEWSAASAIVPYVPGRYTKPLLKYISPTDLTKMGKYAPGALKYLGYSDEFAYAVKRGDTIHAATNTRGKTIWLAEGSVEQNWGWSHIVDDHQLATSANEFADAFGSQYSDLENCKGLIMETVEKGTYTNNPVPKKGVAYLMQVDDKHYLKVAVNEHGSITTAHPLSTTAAKDEIERFGRK